MPRSAHALHLSRRPPFDVHPTVGMRAKKKHGDSEGRRPATATTSAAAEGPSSRLFVFAVQSVRELGRGRKEDGDYEEDGGGGGGGGGEEEEEEEGVLGAQVTAVVDPMMPGRVSPPPRRPGAKWPGFLVNRSVNPSKSIKAVFSRLSVKATPVFGHPLHLMLFQIGTPV